MTSPIASSPQRLHLLALAIAGALACTPPPAAAAAAAQSLGPVVADGDQLDVIEGSYASADDGAAGYVFHALNRGSIGSAGPVSLTATGANTSAARAESGGVLVFTAGDITTSGDNATGLSIATNGRAELYADGTGRGTAVTTSGVRSIAAQVDAGSLFLRNATLQTSGAAAHGLAANAGALVDVVGGRIHTRGMQSHAVMANGGMVTLQHAQIQTDTAASDGLYALNGGDIQAINVDVATAGHGSAGTLVHGGSSLTLIDSRIRTHGESARGVSGAGKVVVLNTDVHVSGNQTRAVELSAGTLIIEESALRADHERSDGVYLWDNNQAYIARTTITAGHYGININGSGNDVSLLDVDITTDGFLGVGIWLPGVSTLNMIGGSITTTPAVGVAIDNRASAVTLQGTRIHTAGVSAHGLYASMDVGRGQPVFDADRVQLTTTAAGSIGAVARLGGSIHLRDSSLLTTGIKSYGVLTGGTGVLTLRDSHVRTQGVETYAGVVNDNGSLDINGGSLVSERHAALWVRTARQVTARNGAQLSGGNGTLMAVDASFAAPFEFSLDQDVQAEGDIVITPEDIIIGLPVLADIRVRLNGRSHWRGATDVVNAVALSDDSRWTLTGDSKVGQLDLRDSTLALSAPGATAFNRLTVEGDFEAHNGLLIFKGALGADDAPIDFLHVRGDTRGNAGIQVNNVNGLGAKTINGIRLIQVDGASDATYTLSGRAVAGSYDYFLHKGGVNTPGDGGWYLRSELPPTPPDPCDLDPTGPGCGTPPPPEPCDIDPTGPGCVVPPPPEPCDVDPDGPGCVAPPPPVPDPCEADPDAPGCGVVPPDPCEADPNAAGCDRPPPPQILRPEAGAYLANQAAAVALFQHRLQDRHAQAAGDEEGAGWLRVTSSHTRQNVAGQLALTGRASMLMGGMDLLHWGGAGQGSAGVLLAAGQASTDVRSQRSGYTATGTVKGSAAGLYASWAQQPDAGTGAYADGWVQHGRYRTTVQGIGLAKERQQARTTAASLETGYAWALQIRGAARLLVQPQLQLTYTDYRADRLVEHSGTQVASGGAGGLSSRVGIRVAGDVVTDTHRVQPFVSAHWLREGGHNRVWMDDTVVAGAVPHNRYELRGGATLRLGTRWSAWGDLGLQRGYRGATAQLGLKAGW